MTDITNSEPTTSRPSRLLPWTGVGAGACGAIATMMSSTAVDASERRADPSGAVVGAFEGLGPTLKVSAALGFAATALLVLFITDLRRRLAAQEPAGGVRPALAWAGGLITGGALTVAFTFTAINATILDEGYRDTTLETFSVIADNLAFAAWTPLGLSMVAVATGAFRNGSVPRWLGGVSAVLVTALVAALLVGLPFASWALGCSWLLLAGFGVSRDRSAALT